MRPQPNPCSVIRAYEIADECMLELLRGHALRHDEFGQIWSFADEHGEEVVTLAEAEPAVQEAVEWLVGRGMAELVCGDDDEFLLLKVEA